MLENSPINAEQLDVMQELVNIGVGRAAGVLNQMTRAHVHLDAPEARVLTPEQVPEHTLLGADDRIASVRLSFEGSFSGTAALVFPPNSAMNLVSIIAGGEPLALDMDSLRIGALQEVGNIVLNGVMGSISNAIDDHLDYMPPDYFEDTLQNLFYEYNDSKSLIIYIRISFAVEGHLIQGDIIILFKVGTFDRLLDGLNRVLVKMGISS